MPSKSRSSISRLSLAAFYILVTIPKHIFAQNSDDPQQVFENSRITFYSVDVNSLVCADLAVPADKRIVSLNTEQWNNGAHCGQKVQIEANELITEGTILDECPACGFGNLDLSTEFFSVYGALKEGELTGFWHFETSTSDSTATVPTTSSSTLQGSTTSPPSSSSLETSLSTNDTQHAKQNRVPVVVGASVGGTIGLIILIAGSLLWWKYKLGTPVQRSPAADRGDRRQILLDRLRPNNRAQAIYPYHVGERASGTAATPNRSPNWRSVAEKQAHLTSSNTQSTRKSDTFEREVDPLGLSISRSSLAISRPRSSSDSLALGGESTVTTRQLRLRQEADELRAQMMAFRQEMASSGDQIQRMMAHIQRLEAQMESNWARGLTDEREPPPVYDSL